MSDQHTKPSIHVSVLPRETIDNLSLKPGSVVIDGTLGGGGHTRKIADIVGKDGLVIGLDRDPEAIMRCELSLAGQPVVLSQSNFAEASDVLDELGITKVDGILLDLGLSSDQLEDDTRGFSFNSDGPLDLRFDKHEGEPAYRLINRMRQEPLANLIFEFGEERLSRRIARKLVGLRGQEELRSAKQIADAIYGYYPNPGRQRIHPATRTFQALRIAVNDELRSLESALKRLPDLLNEDGRLCIISFHSLEDRRVKRAFRADERLEVLTRKPIIAGDEELHNNARSRSAKLRVARRR